MITDTPILLVEDDEINKIVLIESFPDLQIDVATTPQLALSMIQNKNYKLILMDINLSDKQFTGISLMEKIRNDFDFYKRVPIFAVTAYAMPGDEKRLIQTGFDRYYSKPIDFEILRKGIENILNNT